MARFPRLSDFGTLSPALARREQEAVRLALLLTAGVLQAGAFSGHITIIGRDAYERFAWLRTALQPLTSKSATIRQVVRLLDLEGPRIAWDEPAVLRRHLRRLAVMASRMGATKCSGEAVVHERRTGRGRRSGIDPHPR